MFAHELDAGRQLRPYEESDTDELYALIDANRELLLPWMPWAAKQTHEGTREFIRTARRQWADGAALEAAIVQDGALIGAIGLNRVDRVNASANIGYWLAQVGQGRGTVTLAAAAMIGWAFGGPWQLHRVEIRAGIENARSRAIPERLGFTFEGVRRGAERVGDHWLDHAVYGLLADEWSGAPSHAGV